MLWGDGRVRLAVRVWCLYLFSLVACLGCGCVGGQCSPCS